MRNWMKASASIVLAAWMAGCSSSPTRQAGNDPITAEAGSTGASTGATSPENTDAATPITPGDPTAANRDPVATAPAEDRIAAMAKRIDDVQKRAATVREAARKPGRTYRGSEERLQRFVTSLYEYLGAAKEELRMLRSGVEMTPEDRLERIELLTAAISRAVDQFEAE